MGPILAIIARAVLSGLVGYLINAGLVKATAPMAYAAPLGLSSTGLYVAAAFVAGIWVATHPNLGVNLLGRMNNAAKEWIRSIFAQTPAK